MSWIENIQSVLTITTGDGRQFSPLWMPASKQVEYNIAEFEFPNLAGTLVTRGTQKGTKYNIEIYFQGENFLDESNAFESSAADSRAWVISHPYYGNITVQPVSLTFDNTLYNSAKITGTVIETITEDKPKITLDPKDKISADKETLDATVSDAFDATPETTDINLMTANNEKVYLEGVKIIKLDVDAEEYFNLYNVANSVVLNATTDPIKAIQAVQAMITYPAMLAVSVKSRIETLSNQFNLLRDSLGTIGGRAEKRIYEASAGTVISSQALAASTPISGDYGNKNKVLEIIEILLDDYNAFLEDLDSIQSANGGDPDSYIPDANSLIGLNNLINYTVSNLFNIALNSKQERTILVENDTNLILLAHRFYGLQQDDSTIEELIANNNIGLNEILQIRKGREIVYYV